MPRVKMNEEDKRQTIAFSMKKADIKRLDEFIDKEKKKRPYTKISRQTVIEGLTLDLLNAQSYLKEK